MELLLIRHAVAFERDRLRWANDDLRPLTARGVRRMRKAAAGLGRFVAVPSEVLVSPLLRARQTADILREEAGWPAAVVAKILAPGQSAASVLEAIAAHRGARLAVIGHEPELGGLLSYCISDRMGGKSLVLKKGGVACVSLPRVASRGNGRLRWMLTPGALRAMAR